jgi:hypothetical protein
VEHVAFDDREPLVRIASFSGLRASTVTRCPRSSASATIN